MGVSFPQGIARALTALDGKISNRQQITYERKQACFKQVIRGDECRNPYTRDGKSTEVAAVVLSKMNVPKAAALLGAIPGPRAREIIYAILQTSDVLPSAVDSIGLSLAAELSVVPLMAFDEGPVEQVGAIFNSPTTLTREDKLEGLQESDETFATAVRKAISTFANIPTRVVGRDITRILRDADPDDLIRTIAVAKVAGVQASADYILGKTCQVGWLPNC